MSTPASSANAVPWLYWEAIGRSRTASQSYLDCVSSIWYLHDETFNIWSHLAAAAYFTFKALRFTIRRWNTSSGAVWAALLFQLGAALCFCLSTLYHSFANHIHAGLWQRMDHFGISAFIWASSSTFVILCFADYRATQQFYTMALTALALLSLAQLRNDVTHWAEVSWARVGTHAIYGGLASLPALHCASDLTHQQSQARQQLLRSFCALILVNLVGGILYATELLEQTTQAYTGLVGTSHQFMHVSAIAGAWLFNEGIQTFLVSDLRNERSQEITPTRTTVILALAGHERRKQK